MDYEENCMLQLENGNVHLFMYMHALDTPMKHRHSCGGIQAELDANTDIVSSSVE